MKKQKYQICKRDHKLAVPVDWRNLPNDLIKKINPELIYNVLGVKETGDLEIRSVLFFRPVDNFKKDIITFTVDKIEFGI